ncbi:hypothetical protein RchiOBHm_Chr2g0122491 [Rosa chinensis]|uniref:Uncharacterized protein n=1 Tax=Rosa chinensis TaxID=74649 RepID=A0A2P6RSS7_ROSCH|nr:hypothetical protein RchiOBHm_Chr2g0122491 [Rosa chinensis]
MCRCFCANNKNIRKGYRNFGKLTIVYNFVRYLLLFLLLYSLEGCYTWTSHDHVSNSKGFSLRTLNDFVGSHCPDDFHYSVVDAISTWME